MAKKSSTFKTGDSSQSICGYSNVNIEASDSTDLGLPLKNSTCHAIGIMVTVPTSFLGHVGNVFVCYQIKCNIER